MRHRFWPLIAAAIGSVLAHSSVEAQEAAKTASPWYAGVNAGRSDFRGGCPSFASCDTTDTAYRLYGAYQYHPNLAAELGYADFGKTTASVGNLGAEVKATGWTFHLVASSGPLIERVSIFGKIGAIFGETKRSGSFEGGKERGTDLAYGGGVRYDITRNIGASLEWERYRFDKAGGADLDFVSLGVRYVF
jgi:OOP family OmpA-OmpF porin